MATTNTELNGRVALVTGGTRGLGFAVARAFHDAGASVMITGRDATRGERALAEFGDPARVAFERGDVMIRGELEACVDRAAGKFGKLDILVNNAADLPSGAYRPFGEVPYDAWRDAVTVCLHSVFVASQRALPGMIDRGWGRIINMSSVEGKEASSAPAAYVASKHAVNGLTKALARDVGAFGITVNAICPGLCATERIADPESRAQLAAGMGLTGDELVAGFTDRMATKRLVEPAEVGRFAVFLASDAAASITGAQLSIDGGQSSY